MLACHQFWTTDQPASPTRSSPAVYPVCIEFTRLGDNRIQLPVSVTRSFVAELVYSCLVDLTDFTSTNITNADMTNADMTNARTTTNSESGPDLKTELALARALIDEEAAALRHLASGLDERFNAAVALIAMCANEGGTVLVTGLGKSGLIGMKISATLASLGIASHSVHPSEAAHGDLGRFRAKDVVIALSYSGETDEVVNLASILHQDELPIISITNGQKTGKSTTNASDSSEANTPRVSSLERLATVALTLNIAGEAGEPEFIAPTSSTTATLALGDALALAAARRRSFTDADFARRHPGGSLGGLLRPVSELLRFVAGKNLPLVPSSVTVLEALTTSASVARRPGAMVIVDTASGKLAGIFTDGDLRRLVLRDASELTRPIAEVMTRSPRTLQSDALIKDAVRLVREHRQDEIPVVDETGRPVGVLDVQDLIAMRLVKD